MSAGRWQLEAQEIEGDAGEEAEKAGNAAATAWTHAARAKTR